MLGTRNLLVPLSLIFLVERSIVLFVLPWPVSLVFQPQKTTVVHWFESDIRYLAHQQC